MKIIDGHDVIEHAEVNREDREFIRILMDYIEDADEVDTLYCCDRKKCENCNPDCFLTRGKSHAGKPPSVLIIDGIEMVPSVVEPKIDNATLIRLIKERSVDISGVQIRKIKGPLFGERKGADDE